MTDQQRLFSDRPVILLTDSGLGGLSVLANIEQKLRGTDARIIFFNALYDTNFGYNRISDHSKKLFVFNSALQSMKEKFSPDIILVACNTLSVLFPETNFARSVATNVLGIVETGVEMVFSKLHTDSNSVAVIYGTPTTINSHAHQSLLINKGINSSKIYEQPCYLLESEIQLDPGSKKVHEMIYNFTRGMCDQLPKPSKKIYVLLACTHYEYSLPVFESVLQNFFNDFEILNPNKLMSEELFNSTSIQKTTGDSSVEIYSRVEVTNEEMNSLGGLLKLTSQKTYDALLNYNLDRNLF